MRAREKELEDVVVERIVQIATYQTNECVDASTCKKPIHKRAFGRHHVGIFLRLLFGPLLPRELRPVSSGYLLLQSFAMGGRVELRGLLEDPRLRGTGRCISTGGQDMTSYLRRFNRSG